jgi:RNA polymerase sigma-70 factor, ECF subfamily
MMLLVQEKTGKGIPVSIEQLANDHYDRVFRFCSMRVGFHHAGDAAQETFLIAQRSIKRFRGESSPLTWLIGIAHNECRRLNRISQREAPLPEFNPAESAESQLIDRHVLRLALSKLSDEHREVVIFHEIDELTYEEISSILEIPVGTVKSRLHHAFLNLRRILGIEGGL